MLQAFRDHYRDAVQTQGEPPLFFWLGVVGDASASLIHEHRAVLSDGRWLMKKLLLGLLVVRLAALGLVLANLPARASAQHPGLPISDPIWRPVLEQAMLVLTLFLYAALVAAIVQVVRNAVGSQNRPSWVRLGLTLGGS
jgi:hypothetical protein